MNRLPLDAPDHSLIDAANVPATFEQYWAKQQKRHEAAAARQAAPSQAGNGREEL